MIQDAPSLAEMLKVLHPHRYSSHHDNLVNDGLSKEQRFSTLLLEHGEQELQDWGVIASSSRSRNSSAADENASSSSSLAPAPPSSPFVSPKKSSDGSKKARSNREPSTNMKSVQGRLRLCSKSIVFEPNDISRGIIRIPFDKMIDAPTNDTSATNANAGDKTITLQSKRCTVMKKNNVIAPYDMVDKRVVFSFTFQHSSTKFFMDLFEQIYNVTLEKLEEIIKPMCDQPFDPSNFIHMNEVPQTGNLRAFILGPFPLVKKAGCAIVTGERLYFQPFNGVQSAIATKALSWSLSDIVAFARRYHGLKDEAMELFFDEGPSVLLAFEGYRNREEIIKLLPVKRLVGGVEAPLICHTDRSFVKMAVNAWRNGEIGNFDYLLALNSAAGRSLFDLSRYPIFPWVISDYGCSKLDWSIASCEKEGNGVASKMFRDLTKPIGALNKERLDSFKARWKGMQDMGDAFLYGTHYSAPGYCLYYLVRTMPEQMLCLQNG